jgi:hypothetical protein
MTKKSSQELLNEILLHMKYDSSLTLSENKEMLVEQNTFYYDNLGNLKGGGPVSVPTGARMASKLFPNLNQSQYPKKILTAPQVPKPTTNYQIPTVNRNPKYQQLLRDYNLPADLETKKDVKAIIANSLVSGEYDEFKNKLKTIYPEFYTKLQPSPKPKPKPKVGPKVDTRSYSDATRVAPGAFGTPQTPLASDEQMAVVKFMTPKKIDVRFNDEFEVPGTSELIFWNQNDHNDLKSFANSVTFKSGNINDWAVYITTPSKQNETSKNYNMPIGVVKGFTFKYRGVDLTFKRTVTSDEFLNEFGTILNGNYVKYVTSDYLIPSFWKDWGPTILNMASVAVAVLGPATLPLLLTSAGLDVAAANLQYKEGDIEGAKLSALLALTPFLGKFAISVPKSEATALARKFIGANNKTDIENIVRTLSDTELKTLQSLQELGDIKNVQKMVSDPEVKLAINKEAKNIKGVSSKTLQRTGIELSSAGLALASKWKDITEQELSNMTRKELLKQTIQLASEMSKDNESKKTLKTLSDSVGKIGKDQILLELRTLILSLKKKEEEKIKKSESDINEILDFLSEPINFENKINDDSIKIIDNINNIGSIVLK